VRLPDMRCVEQTFRQPQIDDPASIARTAALSLAAGVVRPGDRIAVPVGSRGIAHIAGIVKAVIHALRDLRAQPFIIPAMGSHGGGTAEGQARVLETLGITEQTTGAPVVSSMEVIPLGSTPEGIPVVIDANAARADHVLLINRVKPHTEFGGRYQSGLAKMLLIGLGKHQGAIRYHQAAVEMPFETLVFSAAQVVLERLPVLGGLAVLENAHGQVAEVVAVQADNLLRDEPALLARATKYMATIPFDNIDLLIVDELGKDISGSGMDTNVIRRKHWADTRIGEIVERLAPRRVFVRDLTEATEGNAAGIGLADFALTRVVNKVEWRKTRMNAITATRPRGAMVPVLCENDAEAIEASLASAGVGDTAAARIVRIRNTACLNHMHVSDTLLPHAHAEASLTYGEEPFALAFDEDGMLVPDKLPRGS